MVIARVGCWSAGLHASVVISDCCNAGYVVRHAAGAARALGLTGQPRIRTSVLLCSRKDALRAANYCTATAHSQQGTWPTRGPIAASLNFNLHNSACCHNGREADPRDVSSSPPGALLGKPQLQADPRGGESSLAAREHEQRGGADGAAARRALRARGAALAPVARPRDRRRRSGQRSRRTVGARPSARRAAFRHGTLPRADAADGHCGGARRRDPGPPRSRGLQRRPAAAAAPQVPPGAAGPGPCAAAAAPRGRGGCGRAARGSARR